MQGFLRSMQRVDEEPEAAQAQVSTVNPRHGLEGLPNAQAQVFTLSAVSG
jgi:hypothetical protein